MFQRILFGTMAVLVVPMLAIAAEPKDDLQAAVKKLSDSASYSWTTKVEGRFGFGAGDGKTEKDGYTIVSVKLRDDSYTVIMKGDKAAIKGTGGWASAAELAKDAEESGNNFSPERFLTMLVKNFKTPAEQATELTGKLETVSKSGDTYAAELSPETAKQLLSFRRRGGDNNAPQFEVKDPKGSLKCWISDGALSKMELHLEGTVSFNGNENKIDRTTTTEIKDVGSTKVAVPDEAKAKL
jgi:hypothetical protein